MSRTVVQFTRSTNEWANEVQYHGSPASFIRDEADGAELDPDLMPLTMYDAAHRTMFIDYPPDDTGLVYVFANITQAEYDETKAVIDALYPM